MTGLFVALAAVLAFEIRLRRHGVTHVSATDAVRLINKGAIVVDVRDAEAFGQGHIVNARNVGLDKIAQGEDAIGKQKNKVLIAVCDDGTAGGKAATLLRKAGYENSFSLKDGLRGWRADNLPIVKT